MIDSVVSLLLLLISKGRSPIEAILFTEYFARIVEPLLLSLGVVWCRFTSRFYRSANILLVGVVANLLVLLANGGLMPVEQSVYAQIIEVEPTNVRLGWIAHSPHTVVSDGSANLEFFSDWLEIKVDGQVKAVASPGDITAIIGCLTLLSEMLVKIVQSVRKNVNYRYSY